MNESELVWVPARVRRGHTFALRRLVLAGVPKLVAVRNARLFATRHRPPQLKLFALEDALGKGGWLTALALDGYAARSRNKPKALQGILFSYLEAL